MSLSRLIIPPYSVSKLSPCDCLFFIFPKNSCTPHNLVNVWDSYLKLYRNVYQVKIVCRIPVLLLSVSELLPFVFYAYIV